MPLLKKPFSQELSSLQSKESVALMQGGEPLLSNARDFGSRFKACNFLYSLSFAFEGLLYATRTQRNFRIHLLMAATALASAILFQVTLVEWAILWGIIGIVLFAELANTILEVFVDLITEGRYDYRAKVIKDMAAGAVLVASLSALAIGVCIFLPHLLRLFH